MGDSLPGTKYVCQTSWRLLLEEIGLNSDAAPKT